MGFGGALIWTGLARNLRMRSPEKRIALVYNGSLGSEFLGRPLPEHVIFNNNRDIAAAVHRKRWAVIGRFYGNEVVEVDMDDPRCLYWEKDLPDRMVYRKGAHAIKLACAAHGIDDPVLMPRITLTEAEIERASIVLEEKRVERRAYICIEPCSKKGFTQNKEWPFERWRSLAAALVCRLAPSGIRVVRIGSEACEPLEGVVDISGMTTFREAAHIIRNSLGLVTHEGGLAHLAAAVGTRSVVLMSSMIPKELMAYPSNINLYTEIACAGCGLKGPCPRKLECMLRISVDEALQACVRMIETGPGIEERRDA